MGTASGGKGSQAAIVQGSRHAELGQGLSPVVGVEAHAFFFDMLLITEVSKSNGATGLTK